MKRQEIQVAFILVRYLVRYHYYAVGHMSHICLASYCKLCLSLNICILFLLLKLIVEVNGSRQYNPVNHMCFRF